MPKYELSYIVRGSTIVDAPDLDSAHELLIDLHQSDSLDGHDEIELIDSIEIEE